MKKRRDLVWDAKSVSVKTLAGALGRTSTSLCSSAARIPVRGYHEFLLSVGSKKRVIHAPEEWLKSIQRQLVDEIFPFLPIAEQVFSQRGRDVVKNAAVHINHSHMVVIDVKDCFPSTTLAMIRSAFQSRGFRPDVVGLLSRLVSHKGRLPQGPPSSPGVLNLVFTEIDSIMNTVALENNAIYTRYVDDLCFSGDAPLDGVRRAAIRILRGRGYGVRADKVKTWGPDDRHTVTKIVVASSLQVDPNYLDALINALRQFRKRPFDVSRQSLLGRIDWVSRLDPPRGAQLRKEFLDHLTR